MIQAQTPARTYLRLALIVAAITALALSLVVGVRPAAAGGGATLNPGVIGTDSSNPDDLEQFPCPAGDEELVPAGQVMWHFILNGLDPGITSAITGHFDFTPDSADQDEQSSKWNNDGSNHQFFVFTNGDAILDGATADIGASTYSQFTLSHICVGATVASQPPSVPPSVPASVPASVPGSAEGSVGGGTGTPAASLANTAVSLSGSGPLATIFFGAVLIASLGALAYANVTAVRRRR